jgi:hypothetical protein
MKEYNSIPLEEKEVETLNDIAALSREDPKGVQFTGDIDKAIINKELRYISRESFCYEKNHIIGLSFNHSKLTLLIFLMYLIP